LGTRTVHVLLGVMEASNLMTTLGKRIKDLPTEALEVFAVAKDHAHRVITSHDSSPPMLLHLPRGAKRRGLIS
jgi:hypothetical protein